MKRRLVILLVSVMVAASLCGCSDGDGETQYDRDFKNGMEKYNKGEPMTYGEARAVQNFKDWQSKQGEKTFDEWNN